MILAVLMIWPFVGLIVGLALGGMIARADRDAEPAQGGTDARRGGVDQVFHDQGDM